MSATAGASAGFPRGGPWPAVGLALLVLVAYASSFPGGYFYDDYPIIRDNPLVVEPRVPAILTADYWGEGVNSGLHRPLTILSYVANRALFGTSAFSFHLVNVLLHAGVTLLFHAVLLAAGLGAGVSWAAAALFAVHPIHTEAVNVITGRSELLAALFMFLGLRLAFRRGGWHHLWVGASQGAALFSKESSVAFPLLLVLGEAFAEPDLRTLLRRRWRLYAQSAAIALLWLGMRRWALPSSTIPFNASIRPLDNPLVDFALPWRIATALKVQLLYLGKLLWPATLHPAYTDRMMGPVRSLADPWAFAALLIPAGLAALAIHGWRRRQPYALGLAWYAAGFLVLSNLLYITPYLMAERFAYTPSAGFCLAAAALAAALPGAIGERVRSRRVGPALLATVLLLLVGRTVARNADYATHVGFWEAGTRSEPANIRAWLFLAAAYQEEGRWEDAERALRSAARVDPGLPEPWIGLGTLFLRRGRFGEARDAFRTGLDTGFANEEALTGYVTASLRLGYPEDALAVLSWLADLFRERGVYWHLLGQARESAGDAAGAVEAFRRALTLEGCPAETPRALRELLRRLDRDQEAVEVPEAPGESSLRGRPE